MSSINYLRQFCLQNKEYLLQDSNQPNKIYWFDNRIDESRKEINLPKSDQTYHARTSLDYMPSSLLGVNVSEVFSLLVQIAQVGTYIERKRGTPTKAHKVAEMILKKIPFKDLKRDEIGDITFNNAESKALDIIAEWIFENIAQYREDRTPKINTSFITIFPYHSLIPRFWGIKESKRVVRLLKQLLTYDVISGKEDTHILESVIELLDDTKVQSIGILGKILLIAIQKEMMERGGKIEEDYTESDFEKPFCTVHTKMLQEDLVNLLDYSKIINRETIIKWFYSSLSTHLALYVLRLAKFFQAFIDKINILGTKLDTDVDFSACKNCSLDSTTIYKCPYQPDIYPKLDNDPVVHKRSRYALQSKENEIILKNLSVNLILFNHLRTATNIYCDTSNGRHKAQFILEKFASDVNFQKFLELYFGVLNSKYLDISTTIERKEEFFEELTIQDPSKAQNIKLFHNLVSNHFKNVKSTKDSRKHFFAFYRNMSFSGANGFLSKRRGVGNYYNLSDTYIQVLTQLATKESDMITFEQFNRFIENRGIKISIIDDPDSMENQNLKEKLNKLGLFFGASDAKEAQFVYSLVI